MIPVGDKCPHNLKNCCRVILDGRVLGFILQQDSKRIAEELRCLKVEGIKVINF